MISLVPQQDLSEGLVTRLLDDDVPTADRPASQLQWQGKAYLIGGG